MRINKYLALHSDLSRRAADKAVFDGHVLVNGQLPTMGQEITEQDTVLLDGRPLGKEVVIETILFYKPVGYIVSRDGQGGRTIYDILPPEFHNLKPVGRLDKDSSGLLLLTNNGELAQSLTHPSFRKVKIYEVSLHKPLAPLHRQMIGEIGVQLEDGPSKLGLERIQDGDDTMWRITMHEGRNRQIRRTFNSLGYEVVRLHRSHLGNYVLPTSLKPGDYRLV